jgi:hypothetical protein
LGFFRAPSGLGYALGVKLALPQRLVVVTIGYGTLMYNPLVPALSFADEHKLPLLILVFNNSKYASMQYFHKKFYPSGTAITTDDYYGVHIKGVKYEGRRHGRRLWQARRAPSRAQERVAGGAGLRPVGQDRHSQCDHARSRQPALNAAGYSCLTRSGGPRCSRLKLAADQRIEILRRAADRLGAQLLNRVITSGACSA